MSMYTNETEVNTPERGWVSLGERRKLRLHNSIHGEMVSSEHPMMEENRKDPNDSLNHQHEEDWISQTRSRDPSNMSTNSSKHELPEGFFSFKQALPNANSRPFRNTGDGAKDKVRESYALNHPPFRHGESLGSLYDNFQPLQNPSEPSQQRGFEKRAFHFTNMGPESGYSVSPGLGQASVVSEERLDESTTEINDSTIFNTPVSVAEVPKPPIPSTSEPTTIANPLTLAGQRIGALLSIMRLPNKIKKITKGSAFNMVMEVGDIVKVLGKVTVSDTNGKDYLDYAVENLRTGARVIVAWSTFLPVGVRELCDCRNQRCRCVYVDFEKSRGFFGIGN